MSLIEPSKIAFNTELLRYALITNLISKQLQDYGFRDITPGISCNNSAELLIVIIKSTHRYVVLKLKTNVLDVEELLQKHLSKQGLVNSTQILKLKIVLG